MKPFSLLSNLLVFVLILRYFVAVSDRHVAAKVFVIFVAHDHPDSLSSRAEMQSVVSARPGWKPVLAVNLFPIGLEARKQVFLALFSNIRDGFTIGFYDLIIAVIHPNLPLEVSLPFFQSLR